MLMMRKLEKQNTTQLLQGVIRRRRGRGGGEGEGGQREREWGKEEGREREKADVPHGDMGKVGSVLLSNALRKRAGGGEGKSGHVFSGLLQHEGCLPSHFAPFPSTTIALGFAKSRDLPLPHPTPHRPEPSASLPFTSAGSCSTATQPKEGALSLITEPSWGFTLPPSLTGTLHIPPPLHPTHLASSNHPPPFLQCCRVSPYRVPHSSQYFPGFPQLSGQRSNLCAPLSVSSSIPPGWMSGREGDPMCGLLEEGLTFLSLRVPPGVLGPGGEGPAPGALSSLSLGRMTFTKGSSCSWFSKGEIRAHGWKDIGQGVRDRGSNTSSATNWLGGFGQPFCDMRGADLRAPSSSTPTIQESRGPNILFSKVQIWYWLPCCTSQEKVISPSL